MGLEGIGILTNFFLSISIILGLGALWCSAGLVFDWLSARNRRKRIAELSAPKLPKRADVEKEIFSQMNRVIMGGEFRLEGGRYCILEVTKGGFRVHVEGLIEPFHYTIVRAPKQKEES